MAFGFGVLRLSPRDFWTMTPRELMAAFEGTYGAASEGLTRADFDQLSAAFPDQQE
jgi:uncharacterized phage protein (TIGR02216 family)